MYIFSRSINYDERDPFLCNACGFCKYAKFDYTLTARPCCAVDPIENEEDRKKVGINHAQKKVVYGLRHWKGIHHVIEKVNDRLHHFIYIFRLWPASILPWSELTVFTGSCLHIGHLWTCY